MQSPSNHQELASIGHGNRKDIVWLSTEWQGVKVGDVIPFVDVLHPLLKKLRACPRILVVVDDGSSAMVIKALIVASKRAEEHKKRSPKSKDMAKTIFQKMQFFEVPLGGAVVPLEVPLGETESDFWRYRWR